MDTRSRPKFLRKRDTKQKVTYSKSEWSYYNDPLIYAPASEAEFYEPQFVKYEGPHEDPFSQNNFSLADLLRAKFEMENEPCPWPETSPYFQSWHEERNRQKIQRDHMSTGHDPLLALAFENALTLKAHPEEHFARLDEVYSYKSPSTATVARAVAETRLLHGEQFEYHAPEWHTCKEIVFEEPVPQVAIESFDKRGRRHAHALLQPTSPEMDNAVVVGTEIMSKRCHSYPRLTDHQLVSLLVDRLKESTVEHEGQSTTEVNGSDWSEDSNDSGYGTSTESVQGSLRPQRVSLLPPSDERKLNQLAFTKDLLMMLCPKVFDGVIALDVDEVGVMGLSTKLVPPHGVRKHPRWVYDNG